MSFSLEWDTEAKKTYDELRAKAKKSAENRKKTKKTKSSKVEGLFKQVRKCIKFLKLNPRHPGLNTHAYTDLPHPWDSREKVFEAYAQQKTPAAYRVFWCYGPNKGQITIIAIIAHP